MTPRDKARDRHYQRYYGITLEDYNSLLKAQSNRCACCGASTNTFKQRLSVDHSHTSGEIRGLLCFKCNHLIIGRHEDYTIFEKAAKYLKGPHTGWIVPKEYLKGRRKKRRKRK